MIPQPFIDDLIRDADIVSVIGRHVKLTAKGKSHLGLCPFHQEKTPSFNVVPDKGFYHCFGCGVSGTALGFLMRHVHGDDFVAAVHDLAAQLGREVPREQGKKSLPRELVDKMADFYHSQLWDVAKARDYLKSRGISKKNALRFKLGYAPRDGGFSKAFDGHDDPKLERGLIAVGLAKESDRGGGAYPYFRDRVMFPITSNTGKIQGFGGRLMTDGEPKYLNSPQSGVFDKSRAIFGLREATPGFRDKGYSIVVEGYMDVLVLFEHGLDNAVATMGTAATTQQVATLMTRSDKVCFCFDGDEAGRRAAAKVLRNVMPALSDGKSVRFIQLPKGEDPDSYVRANGTESFTELVDSARTLEDFLVDKDALMLGGEDDVSGESVLCHTVVELIEMIDRKKAPFMYEALYKKLSQASGIETASLKEAAKGIRRERPAPSASPQGTPGKQRTMNDHAMYHMLSCLFLKPELVTLLEKVPMDAGKHKQDFALITQLRDSLLMARKNGDSSVSVERLLKDRDLHGLLGQLRKTSMSMKKVKQDPKAKLLKIIRAFKKVEERKKRNDSLNDELAKVS